MTEEDDRPKNPLTAQLYRGVVEDVIRGLQDPDACDDVEPQVLEDLRRVSRISVRR